MCKKKKGKVKPSLIVKAYKRLTHYKRTTKEKRKRNAEDDVLKTASPGRLIQHEFLQKLFWQKPSPMGLVQPCSEHPSM